jgi:hypothetical protein
MYAWNNSNSGIRGIGYEKGLTEANLYHIKANPLPPAGICFVSKVNANIRAILKSGVPDKADICRTYRYQMVCSI